MKTTFLLCILFVLIVPFTVSAKPISGGGTHRVKGHITKDGKYVEPHQKTNPNKTQRDNWTSKPNANPYTGKQGTKEPQK